MVSPDDLARMRGSLAHLEQLLARLADFSSFPTLLTHEDSQVQSFVDRSVINVREARLLTAEVLATLQSDEEHSVAAADRAPLDPLSTGADETHAGPADARGREGKDSVRLVEPPAKLEQITMANPTGLRELILVADPDAGALAEIERILTDEDYRVLSVRDGFEAISIYARLWAAIDLVILDFSLPGMSGELVFDELQAINPKVGVVVSSGFTHPDKLKQMLAQGLSGFMPKPYERERLLRQIQQVLAHRPGIGR